MTNFAAAACWSRDKQGWCYSEITYTFSSQTIVTGDGNAVYHFLLANEGMSTITSHVAFPNLLRIHPESTPFCFWIEMMGNIPHISKNILKIIIFIIINSFGHCISQVWKIHVSHLSNNYGEHPTESTVALVPQNDGFVNDLKKRKL